ncbi:MAG: hypothetical protein GXP26_09195 [Planctomycetes bacterium]|nr:hypothetical protein [Planctomycetota bacterium]
MNKKQKIGARHKSLGASFFRSRSSAQHTASAQRPASSAAPASSRRGILLLVVLSMLTLFLMIGTAYIVTSNQYRRAQKTYARATQAANAPGKQGHLLSEVMNQLLRDTNNEFSNLRYHSLLRDVYGNDGFTGEVSNAAWAPNTGQQILQFKLPGLTDQFGNLATLSSINNVFNGLVLTFLDGSSRGQSTRIVGYFDDGVDKVFRVISVPLANGQTLATPGNLDGSRILINGRPFNGTGVGYNPDPTAPVGSARLNAVESITVDGSPVDVPIALMPNATFFDFSNVSTAGYLPSNNSWVGQGGSDESYDIPDFQNMALAMLPLNPGERADSTGQVLVEVDPGPDGMLGTTDDIQRPLIIPSFHRPALLNYWRQQLLTAGSTSLEVEPSLLRKVLLRPNWWDHPNFTGSNPDLANTAQLFATALRNNNTTEIANQSDILLNSMIYGPWDVDNDNDGIRDSVWVDFGASVMKGPDGRMVKPLAAILVLDMGGRLNLNAHGTLEMVKAAGNLPIAKSLAGGTLSDALARGQGWGPAEISLQSVVDNRFEVLLQGVDTTISKFGGGAPFYDQAYAGRYGLINTITNRVPGISGQFGLQAQLKTQGIPRTANGMLAGNTILGNYASPPDLLGRYALGLNNFGQPAYEVIDDTGTFDGVALDRNSPYELNLSTNGPRGSSTTTNDGAFSIAEMERLLRAYDVDAGTLPPRIWELANGFFPNATATTPDTTELNQWRTLLTTDSYDMPVPNAVLPEWVRNGPDGIANNADDFLRVMGRPPVRASFADLLDYRLRVGLGAADSAFLNPVTFNARPASDPKKRLLRSEMSKLLAPDLADGLRLDINRAIGNGRDDNNPGDPGYGVVDEPGENEGAFWILDSTSPTPVGTSAFVMPANGQIRDDIDRDGLDATDNGTPNDIEPWERGDLDGSGSIDTLDERVAVHNYRRQLLARHLYVMAMALVDPPPAAMTDADKNKRARRLAQWAINIVDFRDPDNCMTAFEYDSDPFDGWDIAIDGIPDAAYLAANQRQLVWGCERPELLITETLAWHDRRTTDETTGIESSSFVNGQAQPAALVTDPINTPPDQDYDQLYRPRGAAFIEIHAPYPANPAANADTHDKTGGIDQGINISAIAGTSPVWRIAVHQRPANVTPLECADWDPDAPDKADQPLTTMDRCIYMAPMPDITTAAASLQAINASEDATAPVIEYFTTLPVPTIRPGRFLVIGSGEKQDGMGNKITPQTGPGIYASEIGSLNPMAGGTIRRRIELNTNNLMTPVKYVEPNDQTPLKGNEIAFVDPGPDGIAGTADDLTRAICDAAVITHAVVRDPNTGNPTSYQRRFTFTEPARGYPGDPSVPITGPSYVADPPPASTINGEGRYGNVATAAAYDTPHDDARVNEVRLQSGALVDEIRLRLPNNPSAQRIVESYSMVYLQRLANPLLPFNNLTNPYRTVDTMSVNVTVFNGAPGDAGQAPGEKRFNGAQVVQYPNTNATQHFASLQRGLVATSLNGVEANLFGNEPPSALVGQPTASQAPPPIGVYDRGFAPTGHTINVIPDFTLGAINHTFLSTADQTALLSRNDANMATLDGITPTQPYPWLTWNNRPYISGNELMLVPRSRSSQLLREFSGEANQINLYAAANVPIKNRTVDNRPAYVPQSKQGTFGHLPNMYLSENPSANKLPDVVAGLSRVLEYIQVPSRFVGTETWLNPAMFGQQISDATDARMNRQPPFNRISSYREPGRVNLNTIVHPDVWDGGILHRTLLSPNNYDPLTGHSGPLFVDTVNGKQGILESRRGYAGVDLTTGAVDAFLDNSMLPLDPNVPTFFANPFRSPDAGNLVPLPQLRRQGTDCQLQRSEKLPQITQAGGMLDPTLTDATPSELKPGGSPLMGGVRATAYNSTVRNPYFRLQPMTRLSNLTTTRSNVYAIWVTVGFFEVEESPNENDFITNNGLTAGPAATALYKKVYPEGYTLGQEAGSETGDIRRIREFAIIDRTIPVGFEPGKNHNVERAVRLRRRIE